MGDEWHDDEDVHRRMPRNVRTAGIVALALVPWVVVAYLMAARPGPPDEPRATGPTPTVAADQAPDFSADSPVRPDGEDSGWSEILDITEFRGGWRLAPGPDSARAVAVTTALAWIERSDPELDVGDLSPSVEGFEQLDDELAVVSILLGPFSDGDEVTVRRVAVPVRISAPGPRPAGAPWWLPEPDIRPSPLTDTSPIQDEVELLAAADALAAAGYSEIDVSALQRTDSWPLVADVVATTPRGMQVEGPVLLRRHLDGYVVAGTVLPDANGDGSQEMVP